VNESAIKKVLQCEHFRWNVFLFVCVLSSAKVCECRRWCVCAVSLGLRKYCS